MHIGAVISHARFPVFRSGVLSFHRNSTRRATALPAQEVLAITQQTIAYGKINPPNNSRSDLDLGVVLIGENLYSRQVLSSDDPGRPQIPAMITSVAGFGTTVGLLSLENEVSQIAGLLAGLATCVYVLTVSVNRIVKTKSDPDSWPGPKSWPVFMSLGASSVALAFLQTIPSLNS